MKTGTRRSALVWIAIAILSGASGCNQGTPKIQFGKVQGILRVNGRPQPNVQVTFNPDKEKGIGLPAYAAAVTDDSGNYSLKYSYLNKTGEGAPVGWNRVTLVDLSGGKSPGSSAIPTAYTNPTMTPFLFEVKAGDNKIDLDVKK